MRTIVKLIALNERSYNVSLLHKALGALGLPVADSEVSEGMAGIDTLKKVRALQERLNVPVDDSVLVDEATALAIATALTERGLTVVERSFTVSGTVRLRTGEVKKRQGLLAFDLDLRGVSVYRTIQNRAEIQEHGGFEFLGEAVSDNLGNYSIMFYDWQYGLAERKKADVVVYAVESEEIIGRSRMINSEDYSDKGLVRDLDVIITQEDARTEYEVLMSALNAFLKESETTLNDIASSGDQLAFTAGELDVDLSRLNIAARAESLTINEEKKLSYELLYGIGRQGIRLTWAALYKKSEEELRTAIAKSVDERIIREFQERQIAVFLQDLQAHAVRHILDDNGADGENTLKAMLENALPQEEQRLSFIHALREFKGSNFREFWDGHLPAQPEFKDNPELISSLLLTQQLTLLTGNHQALVNELQVNRQLASARQLIDLEQSEWLEIIEKTGIPDFIEGGDDEEKTNRYAEMMQTLLNAAFPTQRIANMVAADQLPIENTRVSKSISAFLSTNEQFDFASSRVHDFKHEIREVAGEDYDEVRGELMRIQRAFQVSTTPEAMRALMENNLHSAYTIAGFPRKSFIKTYGAALGGERAAFAIHQRASHISTRAEMAAMHLLEYSHGLLPHSIMDENEYERAMEVIKDHMPNPTPSYVELFGSPDICECEHCRSVYSPAAYFIDLMRFLWRGKPNADTKTPLAVLEARRPDLRHLALTCENTNTLIPYVDLANEVMEYYVPHGSLTNFEGYDTGDTTPEELRANPQNFDLEAYRVLGNNKSGKEAVYPFTLPYHQPLDVIRTYSDHLKVSRYEIMKAMNPQPDPATARAIAAESLGISQEEYIIFTGEDFNGTADTTPLHKFFGYTQPAQLDGLRHVREFLQRSGIAYTDLVELVKTRFINPHQDTLDFLAKIFPYAPINAGDFYKRLKEIETSTLDSTGQVEVEAALTAYNSASGSSLIFTEFAQWVTDYFSEFQQVITLYEPHSKCDLDNTELKTLQNVYEGAASSGIATGTWSKMHRFIRIWRKLGWSIHETDLMLAALGEDDITAGTIGKLESVSLLKTTARLPLSQLAVLWGNIDTYGEKSLYKKLFLNKAVQEIDGAFKADAWGDYLQDGAEILADHQSAILAAFRITEEELDAVLKVAEVIDGSNPRNLDKDSDILNLQNLSTIYRYVVLAKAVKMRVVDLCRLIKLFGASPFSAWNMQQEEFINISPTDTYEFYKLAESTKSAGFKPSVLEYILQGTLPADSKMGLDEDKARHTARTIRDAFAAIEQDTPEMPEAPLTAETLAAKLALTFQPAIVARFMRILEGIATFETITDTNLTMIVPEDLADKYTYIKGSGRLACAGVMSDAERDTLKGLTNASLNFQAAVDELYAAPETFISDNFNEVFTNLTDANKTLLDHPVQTSPASPDKKLGYVYERFLPLLKGKLRRDAIAQHIAALIGLSEEAAALLIAADIDDLITALSTEGFSATYFNDTTWNAFALERVDNAIDFSWSSEAPDTQVTVDNFSARWKAYIAAPASGEYTLIVEVEEADEIFKLYLDDALILEKILADTATSKEVVAHFNAAQMHLLTLEYAETSQNAGVRLRWKTAASAPEVIPASVAYPAAVLDGFVEHALIFHRAAKFISGFAISETELDHLLTFGGDFGNIDFKAPDPQQWAQQWKRVNDYMALRNAVPQAQALLTDIFALANRSDPPPTVEDLREMLRLATAWDGASLEYLVAAPQFALGVEDFKNEIALNRLHQVMQIVSKTGITATTIADWGAAETIFDNLHDTAQLIKRTVKAKYEEEDWLDLAGNLSDRLRENQQQALVSYLMVQPDIQGAGVKDADGLFEYLLIDVQMDACMDTSRVVQANAAIQMFVNRCLLNLESNISGGEEHGVSPGAIDKDRWEWMKNYRVWEANRKVFLYPENWLEPEWRNNRSEFFKELESYLVQNDITDRSVEQAFRSYLTNLNEVANLDVCGMYQEDYEDGNLKYLHVFARTHNAPYKFFYRRCNQDWNWSAWERVTVDIRSVEKGDNSGVHLIPVVWKNRLFLFWPEFIEVQKESVQLDKTKSIEDMGKYQSMESLKSDRHWEIHLAWSEYVEGKWMPKQVTKEFIKALADRELSEYTFRTIIDEKKSLYISLWQRKTVSDLSYDDKIWQFGLSDIQSKVRFWQDLAAPVGSTTYNNDFMKRAKESELEILDDVYLEGSGDHRLLNSNASYLFPDKTLERPFFFSDVRGYRTYFVRPVGITKPGWISTIIDQMRNPRNYKTYRLAIVHDDVRGPIGPDDFMPVDKINLPLVADNSTHETARPGASRTMMMNYNRQGNGDMSKRTAMTRSASGISEKVGEAELGSKSNMVEIAYIDQAFGGLDIKKYIENLVSNVLDTGLEFHTFYHPFSSQFVTNLNQKGVLGLLESDTEITSDQGDTFEDMYSPNFQYGLVKRHSDFATPPSPRTAYKENVCFDVYGANSLYNWELFFHAPLYIATRLSKNGKYEEAMKWFHYIFDPTTDEEPEVGNETSRYWKVLPFKSISPAQSLEDWLGSLSPNTNPNNPENDIIAKWRNNPFDPHLVASNRPLAYMKHVVIKYVENLIAWGDSLFRQFTRESVYEALQLYVIANHCLGPRPEFVPKRGEIKAQSYDSLQYKWDDFSNALVQLENIFPYSSNVNIGSSSSGNGLLGIGPALYFCIPSNEKLLEYWDMVADRLYKIRHCQDIEGVERQLALFAPPISPESLIQAVSQGLSLGSILADLSSPPPIYRFTYLVQKANEFCSDVKALGSELLAALEKKDAEELSRLRASQETQMLELVTAIRERQVLDAKVYREQLTKSRETAEFRLQHYIDLLGNDSATVPAVPAIGAVLTADSQLPADTSITKIETDVDESLVDSDESGVKLIPKEAEELTKSQDAMISQAVATGMEGLAGVFHLFPQLDAEGTPLGVGAGAWWGGQNLGAATSALAKVPAIFSQVYSYESSQAAKMAGYIRREQDWTLQANLAAKEIIQLDKQITSADIRIQVAEKELENHEKQIENAKEVELFLKDKFTNQEMYQWMKEQLYAVYKQSYNLAYEMAKQAEKAYRYEMGTEMASFIQYGYWDNSRQGLAAGEKLQLALRQLEKSYMEENRRELEMTKSISLAMLNPLALIQLKETGKCYLSLPEELFDLDFLGHYFRRIKSVSLSIPCIAGPYTTVNCSLRLLKNTIRINTSLNSEGNYEHENDEGLWIDDNRFRTTNVAVTSIATSTGQNDAGMFEFNFRDERYLPFEGAGVISDWMIELSTEKELRQFDYSTISDVILHLRYTARESGGLFKNNAVSYIKKFLINDAELSDQPFMRIFSMRHEFPTEWHKFLHPAIEGAEQVLSFTIGKERFPFLVQDRAIVVMKIEVFAKCTQAGDYHLVLSYISFDEDDEDTVTSSVITMPQNDKYGGLNKTAINVNDAGLKLDELDITRAMSLKVKRSAAPDYTGLSTKPDEVKDILLVFHYKLAAH